MFFFDYDDVSFIGFTYLDEVNLSKVVMDCISLRWVQGEFQNLLDRIYYIKCAHGSALKVEEIERLMYFIEERYADELGTYGIKWPDIEDTDNGIRDDLSQDKFPTIDEQRAEVRRMVIHAWRTTWNKHAAIKMAADTYKSFPGDNWRENDQYDQASMDKAQGELESAFWDEVNKTAEMYADDEYDVPLHMIIKQVEDYMPRKLSDVDLE